MILLPIGTKSSLALKPKITIGLIIANIIIAVFTFPLANQNSEEIFKVQRDRYARQVQLFIAEHSSKNSDNVYFQAEIEGSAGRIEKAEDYYELEMEVMETLYLAGASIEDLEAHEAELLERTDDYYAESDYETVELFTEWKRLKAKEDKVLQGNVIFALGLVPSKMSRVHTFITYQFLHGGIWHLLGNLLFLWIVGCLLEDSWGRAPFLVFYLAGGAFAGLAHCLQDVSSSTPLIGASGAIAAAMGAFTIRHFWTRIKFFYFFIFFFRPFWGTFHLPAFVFLPFWFIEQVAFKYLTDFVGGSDVAYLAHIAGYAAGVVTALAVRYAGIEEKYIAPMVQRKQVDAGVSKDPRFERACEMMGKGNIERAKALFNQLINERPDDLVMMQDIAVIYKEHGLIEDYGRLADPVLKKLLLKSSYEEAVILAQDIINLPEHNVVNPQFLLRLGKWLSEQDRFGEAHDIYRAIIKENSSPQVSVKASIALARLLNGKMNNPRDALSVLEETKRLQVDVEWADRISEMEAAIKDMNPELCQV